MSRLFKRENKPRERVEQGETRPVLCMFEMSKPHFLHQHTGQAAGMECEQPTLFESEPMP